MVLKELDHVCFEGDAFHDELANDFASEICFGHCVRRVRWVIEFGIGFADLVPQ
jgi:hypothetical protein